MKPDFSTINDMIIGERYYEDGPLFDIPSKIAITFKQFIRPDLHNSKTPYDVLNKLGSQLEILRNKNLESGSKIHLYSDIEKSFERECLSYAMDLIHRY